MGYARFAEKRCGSTCFENSNERVVQILHALPVPFVTTFAWYVRRHGCMYESSNVRLYKLLGKSRWVRDTRIQRAYSMRQDLWQKHDAKALLVL